MAPLETAKPESPLIIDAHLSHHPDHPLFLDHIDADFECDGCNGPGHGPRYRCSVCTAPHFFDLHEQCATCPSSLSSDFHHHPLTLAMTRPGSASLRPCDLCGDDIDGLHYTCSPRHGKGCTFDIHPMCAELPTSVHNSLHCQHPLTLQRCTSAGRCLACSGPFGDKWRYRCGPCGVDAHLECAFGMSSPEEAVAGNPKAAAYGAPSPAAAYGAPALAPAVGWCTLPPPQPQPQPRPMMMLYYQNGCLYVVPLPAMATGMAWNHKNNYQLGQTASSYNYYGYPFNYLQQHEQQKKKKVSGGASTSSSTSTSSSSSSSSSKMKKKCYKGLKRICTLIFSIALHVAMGAAISAIIL